MVKLKSVIEYKFSAMVAHYFTSNVNSLLLCFGKGVEFGPFSYGLSK